MRERIDSVTIDEARPARDLLAFLWQLAKEGKEALRCGGERGRAFHGEIFLRFVLEKKLRETNLDFFPSSPWPNASGFFDILFIYFDGGSLSPYRRGRKNQIGPALFPPDRCCVDELSRSAFFGVDQIAKLLDDVSRDDGFLNRFVTFLSLFSL